ncbi:MAG: quinolinate synthase NadA [Clostridia bacterium]
MNNDKVQQYYKEINKLKKDVNAIILAHYYQRPEIQDIADYVGDSFGLAKTASESDAEVIIFCGVHFMAESAAILSPDKKVYMPEVKAGCPMAEMADAEGLRKLKEEHPNAVVVSYVNTTAAVKAESDYCCTSSNAVKIFDQIPEDKQIIFVPDKNLGNYAAKQSGREIILWPGYCNTHDALLPEDVFEIKQKYPEAQVAAHPECRPEVLDLVDYVGSTAGLMDYVSKTDYKQYIIATEMGMLHSLRNNNPEKEIILASNKLVCPNMKLTTLPNLVEVLRNREHIIKVDEEIAKKAKIALKRMLEVS